MFFSNLLELVEGPTLAERIGQGALALEEALPIAAQIAEALEAAHEQGVVHRALKPVNIKVTPEGVVKVLDFELAKAVSEGQGSGIGDQNGSDSPTMTAGTRMGVLTGTAAYMSPEQARGQAVDRRADIWAFGCVLYEMLTGRAAFAGDEIADVLAAVVRDEPDWSRLPGTVGPRVRDVLERCLEKDARRRWHHVADVRIEFERASRDPASFTDDTRGTGRRNTRERLFRGLAVFAAGAILAGVVAWNLKPASRGEPRPIRFSIADAIPLQWQTGPSTQQTLAISPDGTRVAYVGTQADNLDPVTGLPVKHLYLRGVDEPEGRLVPATEGASNLFFSPDGAWVSFVADGTLMWVQVAGGAPLDICSAMDIFGAAWGPDDRIVFGGGVNSSLMQVPAAGGEPQPLTVPDPEAGEILHGLPQFSPDGRHVVFAVGISSTLSDPQLNSS